MGIIDGKIAEWIAQDLASLLEDDLTRIEEQGEVKAVMDIDSGSDEVIDHVTDWDLGDDSLVVLMASGKRFAVTVTKIS